jgi:PhnB protein
MVLADRSRAAGGDPRAALTIADYSPRFQDAAAGLRQVRRVSQRRIAMPTKVKSVPAGRRAVSPYLIVKGAAEAIEFYKKAFGAVPLTAPIVHSNGHIGHAELKVGDSSIMLADEFPDMNARGPASYGGSPVSLHLYVDDVDKVARQVAAAGGTVKHPVKDMFYGDRMGTFTDPFGHTWHVATHVEDVDLKELQKRAEAAMQQFGGG